MADEQRGNVHSVSEVNGGQWVKVQGTVGGEKASINVEKSALKEMEARQGEKAVREYLAKNLHLGREGKEYPRD